MEEIVDHGYSGATDKRPGLKRLTSLVKSRQVDAVVVVKLDRLFRSLRHIVTTLEEYHELGVQFVSIGDQIDLSSASGRLMLHLLAAFGEFERGLISDRTRLGLAHAVAKGKILGRPPSIHVNKIRELRSQGHTYQAICDEIGCSMGVVTRALQGTPKWTPPEGEKSPAAANSKILEKDARKTADSSAGKIKDE